MRAKIGRLASGAAALAALIGAPLSANAKGADISVVVSGVRYAQGVVRVDICDRGTFLKTTCPYSADTPAQVGSVTVTIPSVPPGVYAAQAYHDANNDRNVDQGVFGLPKEDLGFSNNVTVRMHAPSFDKAAFTHGDEARTLQIRLRHFIGR